MINDHRNAAFLCGSRVEVMGKNAERPRTGVEFILSRGKMEGIFKIGLRVEGFLPSA